MQITETILQNLLLNENYCRKVLPYLKGVYFDHPATRIVFDLIKAHVEKYNARPTTEILKIELDSHSDLNQDLFQEAVTLVDSFTGAVEDENWLIETTETWCKERAIYNGLLDSMNIWKDKKSKRSKGEIPKILEEAIAVSFDTHIGHDYIDDATRRFEYYHHKEKLIPFDLEKFNLITGGGLPPKTLTVVMAGVGVGKTQVMCHFASANLLLGKNVLYITMEMAEERIAERIDANLLDTNLEEIRFIRREVFEERIKRLREKVVGKIVIKEYPTGNASTSHFRHLLHELRLKKKFIPDIIYVDYLNICCSARIRLAPNVGLYLYVKSIAEEVRGLAVEHNIPVVTATQLNREGYQTSDPGMEHTGESFGLPATADMLFAVVSNDELARDNQIEIKQIKNRFSDPQKNRTFIVGRDLSKMRLYDVEARVNQITTVNTAARRFGG